MTLGEFLKQALEHLYGLWPFRIIRDWEQGIRLRHGNATALLDSTNGLFGTGIHVFFPVIGEIIDSDTNIETPETDRQDLITADGELISFSLAVRYRVRDLKLLWLKIHDQDETVLEEVRAAAAEVARQWTLEEVRGGRFGPQVLEQLKARTRGWGLEIISVSPVNMTNAPQLRLITEAGGGGLVSSD